GHGGTGTARPHQPLQARPGAGGDEQGDGGVDDVDGGGGQADEHGEVEPGGGKAAEEEGDDRRARDRQAGDKSYEDRGETVRRQEAADQAAIGSEHFDRGGKAGEGTGQDESDQPEARELGALPNDHDRVAAGEAREHAVGGAVDQQPGEDPDEQRDDDDRRRQAGRRTQAISGADRPACHHLTRAG